METPEQRVERLEERINKDFSTFWGITSALGDALQVAINQSDPRAGAEIVKKLATLRNEPPCSDGGDDASTLFREKYVSTLRSILSHLRPEWHTPETR